MIVDLLSQRNEHHIVGILDDSLCRGTSVSGIVVLGDLAQLNEIVVALQIDGIVVAIGDNWTRARMVAMIREACAHLIFPTLVHPRAHVAGSAEIGRGNVFMAGAVVNANARIGEFCLLNTNSSVDHDSTLGDFVSLAPNSCVGGGTTIGAYTAVCLGANVIDHVCVGEHTVIGAGATVLRDLPGHVVAYGTPARIAREREVGELYHRTNESIGL
ncbi:MAG: NeuD/PglB/VioB family sugar acetyltransferase [Pirellulales bacterium]